MKYFYFSLICFLSFTAYSQDDKKNIIGIGYYNNSLKSSEVFLNRSDFQTAFIEYDWIHQKSYGFGLEIHKSLGSDPNYYSIALKLGFVLNNHQRIQFPIAPYVGFWNLDDRGDTYGSALLGIKSGVRVYITNNLSIQGVYHLARLTVNKINDQRLDNGSFGSFMSIGPAVSLQYYFARET